MTRVAEVLVAFIVIYDLMICHEHKIGGMNAFQRRTDNMALKPVSDIAFAVQFPVLIKRSTRQFKKEIRDQ